jgi:beta-mannosidase
MRELYAPVLIAPWIDDDHLQIYIVSDKLEDLSGEMNISIWDTKTGLINKHKFDITVPQNTSTHVHTASISSLMGTLNPIETVIEIQFQDVRRLVYLVQPRDMDLPRSNVQFRVRRTSNGSEIELRTDVLAKNILLELETGVLPVSQNYFDLLPGETKRVRTSLSTNELSGLRVLTLTDTY